MSLSTKVIKSGLWLQISKFLQLGFSFVITAILARLLSPEDFGLIGIVMIFTMFISNFTVLGFGTAIVQRQDASQEQISTLYWLNFVMGIGTMIIIFFSAQLASIIYKNKEIIPLIQLISLNFLISPFFQTHRKLLEKELKFSVIARINVFASVGSGLIGVTFAIFGFGVYSLIFQSLSLSLINLIAFRLSSNWIPQAKFKISKVKNMIIFSLKMKGALLTQFFERNIDLFILGKLLSPTFFGFYTLANRIIFMPTRRITYTFGEILFPSFSKIQNDLKRIKKIFLKSIQIIAIFIFPVIAILALYSKPLVIMFLGEKWFPVAKILTILAAVVAFQAIEILSISIYASLNIPEVSFKLGLLRTTVIGISVYIGGLNSLISAVYAILFAKTALFFVSLFILKKYIKFSSIEILKNLKGPFFGITSIISLYFLLSYIDVSSSLGVLIRILFNCMVYLLLILIINSNDLKYFFSKIKIKV